MLYIKQINKRFNFANILFQSILIFVLLYILDFYDIPSKLFYDYRIIFIGVLVIIFSFIILEIVNKKLWKVIKVKTINYCDKLLFVGMFTLMLLLVNYFGMYQIWKNIIFLGILIFIVLLIIRMTLINKLIKNSILKNKNIYNIHDLYKGKVKDKGLILLEENAILSSEMDLLDIKLFAIGIENTLLNCSPKETYIMSLIGKWGCGKTSIINILKESINNSDVAVIETFSPWKYDDKYSLFKGFYNFIFKSLGENFGYVNYKETFTKYQNVIFGLVKKGFDLSLDNIFDKDSDNDIDNIKKSINDYISFSNKKLTIVIDDIDRLDKDQILLIFKIIKMVFNFDNIIYILCFDEERINKLFKEELNIDPNYLNKIIQNKIIVPKTDNYMIANIGKTSILNIIENYDIKVFDKTRLNKTLEMIFKNFNDLREVIRFVNNISVAIKCLEIINLDISDLIALEYVKYSDIGLYYQLSNNAKYLISKDNDHGLEYDFEMTDTFNKKAKNNFDILFENKINMIDILSNVFPNVEKYSKSQNIREEYFFPQTDDRRKSVLMKRCFNGRFFSVYFSNRHNFFTQLNDVTTKFIKNINNNNSIEVEMLELIDSVNPNNHDLLFELIDMRIKEINDLNDLFYYLLSTFDLYEDKARFLGITSLGRVQILLATIIKESPTNANNYIDSILEKDLVLTEKVLYWLKPDKYDRNKEFEELYNYGNNLLIEKLDKLIKDKYKLFEKDNYRKGFSWLFYRNYEEEDKKEKAKKFITSQIKKENVFRVLGNCISEYIGNGVSYEYNSKNAELTLDIKKIDRIIKSIDYELNEDQKIVKELYDNMGERETKTIDFTNL